MSRSLEERFWDKVDKNGPVPAHRPELGPCHLWTGACDKDGYGVFGRERAHRAAFRLETGAIPVEQQALHRCDNPPCVRVNHLWLGTHRENHQDKARKGRSPIPWALLHLTEVARGEAHPNALLTQAAVEDIRSNYVPRKVPLRYFAEKYGVALTTIHWAVTGGTWKEGNSGR